jgi:hypothetical protein
VAELRAACWDALAARHPARAAGGPCALQLTGADRRPLPLSPCLGDVLDTGDDVFFQVDTAAVGASASPLNSGVEPHGCTTPSSGDSGPDAPPASPAAASASAVRSALTAAAAAPKPPSSAQPDKAQLIDRGIEPSQPTPHAVQQISDRSAETYSSSSATGKTTSSPQSRGGPAQPAGASAAAPAAALAPLVRALWERAEELAAQLHFRAASEVLQQVGPRPVWGCVGPQGSRPQGVESLVNP